MPEPTQKLNKLLDKVEEVIKEQKKLEKKQEVILDAVASDEQKDFKIETEITQEVTQMGKMEKELTTANIFHSNIIRRIQNNNIIFPIVIIVGVVLVWRGLWVLFDQLPIISYSFVSILLGIAILWIFNRVKSL